MVNLESIERSDYEVWKATNIFQMFQTVYDILLTLKYSYQANLSEDARLSILPILLMMSFDRYLPIATYHIM